MKTYRMRRTEQTTDSTTRVRTNRHQPPKNRLQSAHQWYRTVHTGTFTSTVNVLVRCLPAGCAISLLRVRRCNGICTVLVWPVK
eukprot:scaffold529832_cov36-Prasinocladus_malaysianus.AAC.1